MRGWWFGCRGLRGLGGILLLHEIPVSERLPDLSTGSNSDRTQIRSNISSRWPTGIKPSKHHKKAHKRECCDVRERYVCYVVA